MLKLRNEVLPEPVLRALKVRQNKIDVEIVFEQKVKAAKEEFKKKTPKRVFTAVKSALEIMAPGMKTCAYCEVSVGDEIEHIYPKDFYPEKTFDFSNYLLSCGPCNGPKNSKFAVIRSDNDQFHRLEKLKDEVPTPPPTGTSGFVDPREDDPSDFIQLDLSGSFLFIPCDDLSDNMTKKAEFTIEVLRLNAREELIESRRIAYETYIDRLRIFCDEKRKGASREALDIRLLEFRRMPHSTVLEQMRRNARYFPYLAELFEPCPELNHIFWFDPPLTRR